MQFIVIRVEFFETIELQSYCELWDANQESKFISDLLIDTNNTDTQN